LSFGENILKYRKNILNDLSELVSLSSIAVPGDSQKPYGERCFEALNWILEKGNAMGFSTKNIENRAGHVEYGNSNDYNAVLSHVDVVPAGTWWSSNPFCLTEKDGKLFGRGVVDDKGASIVSLYCLKAMKDLGINAKTKIRTIFGAGEECGMDDMKAYFAKEPLPNMAFTPDSEYGICNREKGILHFEISAKNSENEKQIIKKFESGTAINAVPDQALALLNIEENEAKEIAKLAETLGLDFQLTQISENYQISVKGIAAHASTPEKGKNAAAMLIKLLVDYFGENTLGAFCSFINSYIGTEIDGKSLNLQQGHNNSEALSLNLGIIKINEYCSKAQIDIRYPVTSDGNCISEIIKDKAKTFGLKFNLLSDVPPLFVKENTPLIKLLKTAYKEVTGTAAETYISGGGTYARTLQGRGVAFGPIFPGEESNIHNADENIDIDKFFLHAQICLEAMYQMSTA
jgi:succinyl-diaminopimelate desuccinylase